MLTDVRSALRGLARDRAFTLFSVLALTLGLGLNGSLLVLSRAFLLRPAPVAGPETLLEVLDDYPSTKGDLIGTTTAYDAVRHQPEFAGAAMARAQTSSWIRPEGLQPIQVLHVSQEYLSMVGRHVHRGRDFQPGESRADDSAPVAIVSHRFWRRELGGRSDVLGFQLNLAGRAHAVVGVLPPGFGGHALNQEADVLVPDRTIVLPALQDGRYICTVLTRLRPGVTLTQARARLASLPWCRDFHLALRPYQPMPPLLHTRLARGLAGLHGAALLILAIAVTNVLALQGARLQRRAPELALRAALGARSGQLFRLVLTENLVLALLSGFAALGLAALSGPFLQALQALLPYPPKVPMGFSLWSAGATLALALVLGTLLASLSHLQARRLDLNSPLKARAQGIRSRGLLVAAQAALALVLLCSAVLCLKDLRRQLAIPLGYELDHRYLVVCQPRKVGRDRAEVTPRMEPTLARLQALPGVQRVVLGSGFPLAHSGIRLGGIGILVAGMHDTLPTLGVAVLEGRPLEAGDEDRGRMLVSQSVACQRWPGESPVGKHWKLLGQDLEVVGTVPDLRMGGPTDRLGGYVMLASRHRPLDPGLSDTFLIQAQGPPRAVKAALRAAVRAEMGDIPFDLDSMEELRDKDLSQPRQLLFLSAVLGSLALILSLCGLYGLAAHLAEARKRELGIRVVLGAGPGRILAVLAKGSLLPLVPGLAGGAGLSLAASRLLVSQSAGFVGLDGTVLACTCLALSLAAALACLLPALRAARVNPAQALRSE